MINPSHNMSLNTLTSSSFSFENSWRWSGVKLPQDSRLIRNWLEVKENTSSDDGK